MSEETYTNSQQRWKMPVFHQKENEVSEKWLNRWLTISSFVIIGTILGVGFVSINNKENWENETRCEVYCNCSITQDCPYTFDYDEVKGCDCK